MKVNIKKLTIAAALSLIAFGTAQAQTKLKWAHVYETSEPYHTAALWAAGEIAKRTNNRYTVEVFPASTLGKETDINQGLTLGTVDIIYTGQLFAGRTFGPLAIGGAPFMFRDFDHWKAFATSPLFGELAEGYRQKSGGHKVLAITYYGERHVTSNKAINKPEDMKGIKSACPMRRCTRCSRARSAPTRRRRLRRGLSGSTERHGRRPGESASDDRCEEVLRSAEIHRVDGQSLMRC